MGYVTKVEPGWYTLGYNCINFVMYSMEVCFLITHDLNINLELIDFGPVELELTIALIIASAGVFGNKYMIIPVVEYLPNGTKSIISNTFCWGHFLQTLFIMLISYSVYENIDRFYRKGWYNVFYYMSGPFIIMGTGMIGAYLETKTYMEY